MYIYIYIYTHIHTHVYTHTCQGTDLREQGGGHGPRRRRHRRQQARRPDAPGAGRPGRRLERGRGFRGSLLSLL